MSDLSDKATKRQDYRAPDYRVKSVDLHIDLDPQNTIVRARLDIHPKAQSPTALILNGGAQTLEAISIDGLALGPGDYRLSDGELIIPHPPTKAFMLEMTTRINPSANTALSGLYISSNTFCTQCEAEGFRHITFFPDRPDVLATYTVTLVADAATYPVLLSNGNRTATGQGPDGKHWATWHDPYPKPCYLFALVAGRLAEVRDQFKTMSGREVALSIWVEPGSEDKCTYAMDALKRSMAWDEQVFGLEYDLDVFNIVAVSDFNFGAMENKSLNIFNAKYILASPQTATDADFAGIEAVVAHEYFHNWTGNRVTCRGWFQLSLKEGLTVFRDQEFSADQRGRALKRINDMRALRARQFPEDAGPLAHAVRPDSYLEISNFYTATIYEKGAEIIRMMSQILGRNGFLAGHKLYIERHDGTAATIEDFVAAMSDANGVDLSAFWHWYQEAGTPTVKVSTQYDPRDLSFELTLEQSTPPTPGQPDKSPKPIPIMIGLIGQDGSELAIDGPATAKTLLLSKARDVFRFENIPAAPRLSFNRTYTSPIKVETAASADDLLFLMAYDTDPCARYEAGQQAGLGLMLDQLSGARAIDEDKFIEALGRILDDQSLDPAYMAEAVILPGERYIADQMIVARPAEIYTIRERLRARIGTALSEKWLDHYARHTTNQPFSPDAASAGRRAIRNTALSYLCAGDQAQGSAMAMVHYQSADNMTDRLAALNCLSRMDVPERAQALDDFLDRFKDDTLVVDKWFMIQATSPLPHTFDTVIALTRHPLFNIRNPNKVRSLIGAFASGNPARFHAADGAGYAFLTDWVIELDGINPQTAARMIEPLTQWRRVEPGLADQMRAGLSRILARPGLSKDSFEIATKAL